MSTLIANTVSAMVAALSSAPAVAPQIDRVRLRPQSQGTNQAVAVRPVQSEVTQASLTPGYPVSLRTTVAVDCYARASAGVAPDVAVDSLLENVFQRLMTDPTLGSVVVQLQCKGISYDFDADGTQTTCASLVFEALHRASGGATLT